MEKQIIGYEEDECPVCQSEDIDYHGNEIDGLEYITNCECLECGTRFTCHFELIYRESVVINNNL